MTARALLIWTALLAALLVPIVAATTSPLLEWRDPIYIAGGFAGIAALSLVALQPLLAAEVVPGLTRPRAGRIHLWTGGALVAAVILHVTGLWITSPPDVIDALTFTSATPFSVWGVLAMWLLFAAAALVMLRRRLGLSPKTFKTLHKTLVTLVALGTILHIIPIEGTMEPITKSVALIVLAAALGNALMRTR